MQIEDARDQSSVIYGVQLLSFAPKTELVFLSWKEDASHLQFEAEMSSRPQSIFGCLTPFFAPVKSFKKRAYKASLGMSVVLIAAKTNNKKVIECICI